MKANKPIWYERHPLPPGRKEELMRKGFRIVDSRFKPEGYENPADVDADADKKMSAQQLRDALKEKGIEIPEGAKKAELQALFDKANEPE